jgi:hypothetical protein
MKRLIITEITILLSIMIQHVVAQTQTNEKAAIVRKTTLNYLL